MGRDLIQQKLQDHHVTGEDERKRKKELGWNLHPWEGAVIEEWFLTLGMPFISCKISWDR